MQGVAENSIGSGLDRGASEDDRKAEMELRLRQEQEMMAGVEITVLPDDKARLAQELIKDRTADNPLATVMRKVGVTEEKESLRKRNEDDGGQVWSFIKSRLPFFDWFQRLNSQIVKADLIAGLTVGVMIIPQGMSYANIAGLEFHYGLYSSCLPLLTYAFFGQSRQLGVGPVALVSLLVEAGLRGKLRDAPQSEGGCDFWYQLNETSREEFPQSILCKDAYADMAILCAFINGILQIVASFCQLGFIVSFLGHPVVSGFTSAAAIIIGLSQVQYTFGVKGVKKSPQVHVFLGNLFEALADTNWVVFAFGIIWIVYLMVNRKVAQRIKHPVLKLMGPLGPLIACVIGVLIFELAPEFRDLHHVDVVKGVPAGMSPLSVTRWRFQDVGVVMPTAITVSLIGYMESIAISKNLASKHGYEIEASQELLALGAANLVGSCFSCYPVTGSFSRSAVNNTTGAKSQLAGLITSVWILICLIFFTRAFYNLPKFALAAVVISSVTSLVAIGDAQHLFKVKKNDFLLWIVAFLGTLFLGVELGIGIAVCLSLLIVIYESARPQIQVLWRIPGTSIYRSVKQETGGNFVPGVFIARIGSSLYFANAGYVKETILGYLSDLDQIDKIQYVILEMTPVVSIDSTALHMLHDLVSAFHQRKLNIAFCMVGNRVMKTMELGDLNTYVGKQWFFKTVDDAVHYCVKHQKVRSSKSLSDVDTPTKVSDEPVTLGNEIGFSNTLHDQQTTIFVHLKKGSTVSISDISLILKKQHVIVEKASVDAAPNGSSKHSYLVVDEKSRSQLEEWKIKLIREDLLALADAEGTQPSLYGNDSLREINEKLDFLMKEVGEKAKGNNVGVGCV